MSFLEGLGSFSDKLSPTKPMDDTNFIMDEVSGESNSSGNSPMKDLLERFMKKLDSSSNSQETSDAKKLAQTADKNGDNKLSQSEFLDYCTSKKPSGLSAAQLKNWEANCLKEFEDLSAGGKTISIDQAAKIDFLKAIESPTSSGSNSSSRSYSTTA